MLLCGQGERLKQKIGDIVLKGGDVLLLDTGMFCMAAARYLQTLITMHVDCEFKSCFLEQYIFELCSCCCGQHEPDALCNRRS